MDEVNYETFDNKLEEIGKFDQHDAHTQILEDMVDLLVSGPMSIEEFYDETLNTNIAKSLLAITQEEPAEYTKFVKAVSEIDIFDVKFNNYDDTLYVGLSEDYRDPKAAKSWVNGYMENFQPSEKALR